MRHVVQFLRSYLREHWDVLRHAQIKDAALGVLALIEKWGVDAEGGPDDPADKEETWWRASAPQFMNDGVSC